MVITRERNIYSISDGKSTVKYDMENNVWYGVRGGAIKSVPALVKKDELLPVLVNMSGNKRNKEFGDRIIALGLPTATTYRILTTRLGLYHSISFEDLEKDVWKVYVKCVKQNGTTRAPYNVYIDYLYNTYIEAVGCAGTPTLYSWFDTLPREAKQDKEFVTYGLKYLVKLGNKYDEIVTYINTMLPGNCITNSIKNEVYHDFYNLRYNNYKDYCNWLSEIETTYKKKHFFSSYYKVSNLIEEYKRKKSQELFTERQTSAPIVMENTCNISFYVPTTWEECVKIGNEFHNCVGSYEWNMYLAVGTRYLVVLTDEDTGDKICCDIDIATHQICQYFTHCNRYSNNTNLTTFKSTYQAFLNEQDFA